MTDDRNRRIAYERHRLIETTVAEVTAGSGGRSDPS